MTERMTDKDLLSFDDLNNFPDDDHPHLYYIVWKNWKLARESEKRLGEEVTNLKEELALSQGIVLHDKYTIPNNGWTCYYCGVTFKTPGGASDHFGEVPRGKPAKCKYYDSDVEKLEAENAKLKAEIDKCKGIC